MASLRETLGCADLIPVRVSIQCAHSDNDNRLGSYPDGVHKGSLVQISADWLRSSAWVDQSGAPQTSLDVDASRLVLLDRAPDGDAKEAQGEIPF